MATHESRDAFLFLLSELLPGYSKNTVKCPCMNPLTEQHLIICNKAQRMIVSEEPLLNPGTLVKIRSALTKAILNHPSLTKKYLHFLLSATKLKPNSR